MKNITPNLIKLNTIVVIGLLSCFNVFSQSDLVLEPVGRYIYQSSQRDFTGTDHLLNAVGLSDGRLIMVSNSALTLVNAETMSIAGNTDYAVRSTRGGGRDVALYQDTYAYVNNHQSEGMISSTGFGILEIGLDEIISVKTVKESDVFFEKLNVYGDCLYAAAHNGGIRIYSLSNPENPSLVASLAEGFTDVFDLALSGDSLYVADGAAGLKIVDVSDLNNLVIVAEENTTTAMGTAQDIEVRDGRVYLACGGAGICVYDNGDLSTRTVYPVSGCVEDVSWVGKYLAASRFSGVSVFEIGEGTDMTEVASESTSRFSTKAYIRTAFGVGAANDSTLMVACWNSIDCYQIKSRTQSNVADITSSTQRVRFPINGAVQTHYLVNQGGETLVIDEVSGLTDDFSTTLIPQSLEPGDTVFFDISYTQGNENTGQTLYISSNDPDENPLPIQVFGNTSSLDPGEEVPDFTLQSFYTDRNTGVYYEDEFTLSEQRGKVVWVQMFGTWCPACPSAEVDMQNTIIKEFADNPEVETFVLNENQYDRDSMAWLQTWTSHFYQRGPMLYDADGTVGGDILSQPKVGNMPFGRGFIIDQEGNVEKAFFGHQPQMAISTIYSMLENDDNSSVSKTEDETLVCVYPNPVVDDLKISLSQEYESVDVVVFDNMGKQVLNYYFTNTSELDLDFAHLVQGTYFVQVNTSRNCFVERVIK